MSELEDIEAPTPAPVKRRGPPIVLIAALLAVAAVIAGGLYLASRPAPAQIQGMTETDEIRVAVKAPARIVELRAAEGAQVHRGDVLAIVSSPEISAAVAQAQRAVAADRLARVTYQRSANLFREGVIPAQRRDEARAQADSAREAVTAAQAQVAAMTDGARYTEQGLEVLAPADGEITARAVNGGELAPPGYPLFTLIAPNDLWVTLNVREDQFAGLRMGGEIEGEIPALGRRARFRIDYIAPQGDFATWRAVRQSSGYDVRAFEVRARPAAPIDGLRPGMSVLFARP